MSPATASLPTSTPESLSLTADEIAQIATAAALLPGRWTAATEQTDDGRRYAGLIPPFSRVFAFLIERRADGLGVARPSGEIVTKACTSVAEALVAIRRAMRHS